MQSVIHSHGLVLCFFVLTFQSIPYQFVVLQLKPSGSHHIGSISLKLAYFLFYGTSPLDVPTVSDCYKSLHTFSACTYLATDWWKAMWTNNTGAERMQAWQLLMNNTPPYWNFECSNQIKIYMAEALTERLCEWFLLLSKFSFLVLRLPFNIFF